MHDQNSKPTQVNTVYLFIIKQGGTPVKRWCKYLLLERLIISCMLLWCYTCVFGYYLMPFLVLDLRSSPVSLAASLPSASLVASPDCSVICDDKDFFKLVSGGGRWNNMMVVFHFPPFTFQASGDMSPQKAVALGKLKVRGNFLLLQKLQGIFWIHNHYPKLNQIWFVYFGLSLSKT